MSDIAKKLGQRIRELRSARRMSQEELAFKAGISAAHLGQIERAAKNPTVDTVAKIAWALECAPADLFTAEAAVPLPHSPPLGKIQAQLLAMSEEEQRDILRIIRIFRDYRKRSEPGEPE